MSEVLDKCKENIMQLASEKGFLTFDDIIHLSGDYGLSSSELDELTNHIIIRGVIVYEETPSDGSEEDELDSTDYSRVDYDAIYAEIEEMSPDLSGIIYEARNASAPQTGETESLIRQSMEGNEYARNRIILMYLRNVLKIALSMTKTYELQIEDAVFSGINGLINGINRYNPDGFSVFHSYISMYIQQAIQRECNPIWMEFYYPSYAKEIALKIYQEYDNFLFCSPTRNILDLLNNLSLKYDIPVDKIEEHINLITYQAYNKKSLEELMEDEDFDIVAIDVSAEDSNKHLLELVENMLSGLKEKERDILKKRAGYENYTPMTLEEIGTVYGITRERIRQIESKAIRFCNKKGYRDMFEEYL